MKLGNVKISKGKTKCPGKTSAGKDCPRYCLEGEEACAIHLKKSEIKDIQVSRKSKARDDARCVKMAYIISSSEEEETVINKIEEPTINIPDTSDNDDKLSILLEKLNSSQVKDLCGKFGLSKAGSKKDIVERLDENVKGRINDSRVLYLLLNLHDDIIIQYCKKLKIESRGLKVEDCIEIEKNMDYFTKAEGKERITKQLKKEIWSTYMGEYVDGFCVCCGKTQIGILSFHAGHITAECKGGEISLKNLFPICGTCNLSMGSEDLISYSRRVYPTNKYLIPAIIKREQL